MSDSAGEVAEGEIITTPFGMPTFCRTAVVAPEHMAPMMPFTPSEVTRVSAAAVAAAGSMQVLSLRTGVTVSPSSSMPLSETSFIAISAPWAIGPARDSSGPVKPIRTPILISSALAAEAPSARAAVVMRIFFIAISLQGSGLSGPGYLFVPTGRRAPVCSRMGRIGARRSRGSSVVFAESCPAFRVVMDLGTVAREGGAPGGGVLSPAASAISLAGLPQGDVVKRHQKVVCVPGSFLLTISSMSKAKYILKPPVEL